MNCPGSEEIAACAEGRLDAPESKLVLDHCAECDDCRRELAIAARPLPSNPVPAGLKARTLMAIHRSLERDRDRTSLRLRALPRGPGPSIAWAAAAAILVAIAGLIGMVMLFDGRKPERRPIVKHAPEAIPEREAPRQERIVPPPTSPKAEETPKPREEALPPKVLQPKSEDRPQPAPETAPGPVAPPPPPKFEETRPEAPAPKPSHTVVARALSEVQVTDVTGTVHVKRKGAKDREKLGSVARLSEGDVLTADRGASFQIDGRHPVVLGERACVSIAFAAEDQAPYLHIRAGEAMVDSTGPTRWVVSDGRVAVVIKQARARFLASPGEDCLRVTALTEPLFAQPDGGQVQAIRVGEEFQVGKAGAELRPLDPALVARKIALFDAARPRQRTIFYTSCDPADANRGHFFLQEGSWFKNEALLTREQKDRTILAAIAPNPRFAWRDSLVLRFRAMTNVRSLEVSFRAEEKRYTLFKTFAIERKNVNQWMPLELSLAPGELKFRRDDGQLQLTVTTQDRFDAIRFSARSLDAYGDPKGYILIDDIQVIEREKE